MSPCYRKFFQLVHIPLLHKVVLVHHWAICQKTIGTGICLIRSKVVTTWAIKMRLNSCVVKHRKWCTSLNILVCHLIVIQMARFISVLSVVTLQTSVKNQYNVLALQLTVPVTLCCTHCINVMYVRKRISL